VAIPLNLSICMNEFHFTAYLDSLLEVQSFTKTSTTKEKAVIHNMEQLTKQIVTYSKKRLYALHPALLLTRQMTHINDLFLQ
jgi:hypothetical protein